MKKRNTDNAAVADKEPPKLLPKVIMYDQVTGVPINAQDVRAATDQEANIATVPWKKWYRGRVAQNLGEKATHMAAIRLVLHSLHTRGRIDQTPLDVSIDLNTKRKVVKASEDLPKGTVALPPCRPHTSRVHDKSTHPHRVPIVVTEKSAVADAKPDTRKSGKRGLANRSGPYTTCIPNTKCHKRAKRNSMTQSRHVSAHGSSKVTKHCTLSGLLIA